MNPDIKTEWVKRLRDGRPQARHYLETSNGQCCWGVLCEIAAEAGIVNRVAIEITDSPRSDETVYGYTYAPDNTLRDKMPPTSVYEWAELSDGYDNIRFGSEVTGLTKTSVGHSLEELNDTGLTFNHIANIIEEGL